MVNTDWSYTTGWWMQI